MRSPNQIKADVDRGLEIYAQQAKLKQELEGIEARLEADALDRSSEHQPLEELKEVAA